MRKFTRSFTLLLLSAAALISSCNKESNSGGALPPKDTSNTALILSNMFAGIKNMAPVQTLEVNAGVTQVVRGLMNTKLTFYPNSFKDKNGNIITSGQIDIQLVEMYRPGQVIARRSSATSNGRLLISGGQVYIKAYRAGQEVFPTVYGIGFFSPGGSGQPMALFYGNNNNADSIITWTQATPNAGTVVTGTITDTAVNPPVILYQFDSCTNFNWINCDYFYDITGALLTDISLVMKDSVGLDHTNTEVFLIFPGINSVSFMQMYNPALKTFSLSSNYKVPVGMPFHAISLSLVNGQYHYAELFNQTVTNNMIDTLRPLQKSLPDILFSLGGL